MNWTRGFLRLWAAVAAFSLQLLATDAALSADIRVIPGASGKPAIIILTGDLLPGDQKKFASNALAIEEAIVLFESRGGNLIAGIEIGKAIRLKEFATYVPANTICASACAFAWLGGTKRLLSSNAKVGFHAASIEEGGVSRESGVGNALAGAYLNQLGLPSRAVAYITSTSPDDMRWLTIADAGKVGIEASIFDLESLTPSRSTENLSQTAPSAPKTTKTPSTSNKNTPNDNSRKPRAIAKFNNWGVYAAGSGKSNACYLLAEPVDRNPKSLKRDPGYIFISQRPSEGILNEITFVMGFDVKPGSFPIALVGSMNFIMIAKGGNLWLRNPAQEVDFINALHKNPRLTITAETLRGNTLTDTYSSNGFSDAMNRANKECQSDLAVNFIVQLGFFSSFEEANDKINKYKNHFARQIQGRRLELIEAFVNERKVWRLRSEKLSREDALNLCIRIKDAGGACFIATSN